MSIPQLRPLLCFIFLCTSILLHSQATTDKKHGRNVIHHEDGSISVGRTKNYLKHGKWYTSYPTHKRKSVGRYRHGKAWGEHSGYWPNGNRQWVITYFDGKRNGISATFDQKGDTTQYCTYLYGQRFGYTYERDTVTQYWSRGEMYQDQKTGTWTISNGDSLIVCNYSADKRNGSFHAELFDNRVVHGYYKNDVRDSVWRISMNGHVMIELWYANGKKDKTEKLFFANSDSIYCETRYRSPNDAAVFIINQKPGVPGKIEWYSSFIVDSIHLYHTNGKIQSRSIYKKCYDGKSVVHSANYVYDQNGKLLIKTLSSPDGKDSLRYDYGANGNVTRIVNFKHGSIIATTYYYDNGNMRVRYAEDSIQVYSIEGKKLRMATPAYNKVFAQIDSIENSLAVIPLYNVPDGPESPYRLSDAHDLVLIPPVIPTFPGGNDSLRAFMFRNLKYPRHELETEIEGRVDVQYIVEADGSLTGIQITKVTPENNRAFKNEAIRLVKSMPKWIPGEDASGPVRVLWSLPIRFSLE